LKVETGYFALTLDLEPDHAGLKRESFDILDRSDEIREYLQFLKDRNVPLSVFVTGRVLEERPGTVELFREFGCEFHSHGHGHVPHCPDCSEDIEKGKDAFRSFFGEDPKGYRAPEGKITKRGIRTLEKLGFIFDSSVFPSLYPNPAYYLTVKRNPHFIFDSRVYEFPFAVIRPVNITWSISYQKLFGPGPFDLLSRRFHQGKYLVYDSHLHDFIINDMYKELSPFWRMIYSRNRRAGMSIMKRTLASIEGMGYRFVDFTDLLALEGIR